MITRAFVLGAGLGVRLRPLTDHLPKPLVPIFHKPLITFAFDHLIAAGIEQLVVNTHRLPECFAQEFSETNYRDVPLSFVHEPDLLGTGGGIRNVLPSFGSDTFVVYSGDILTDFALASLFEEHFRAGNKVTLALRKTRFRPSISLRNGRITQIGGDAAEFDFANVSVWNSDLAERIPPGNSVSFIPTLQGAIERNEKIGGLAVPDGEWFNIGSREEYLEVHRRIANENWIPRHLATSAAWPKRVADTAVVDSTTKLDGFYAIGPNAHIAPGVELRDSIVWPGAQIASRTSLQNCIVRAHRTAQGHLRDAII